MEFHLDEDVADGYLLGNLRQRFGVSRGSDITLLRQGFASARFFSYDRATGDLKAKLRLDRDVMCERSELCCHRRRECVMKLQFIVKSAEARHELVFVRINDRNDHKPQFQRSSHTVSISEKAQVDSRLRLPMAKDADSLEYSVRRYELSSIDNENNGLFVLHTDTVASSDEQRAHIKGIFLQLKHNLDREHCQQYEYELRAIDGGVPPLTGTTTLTVNVVDENDNYPLFQQPSYDTEVQENDLRRDFIKQVSDAFIRWHIPSIPLLFTFVEQNN